MSKASSLIIISQFYLLLFFIDESSSRKNVGDCIDSSYEMTEKQVAAAVKLVRNMCMGKAKTTPEEIDKMHQGNWDVDHSAQCYMWCGLNMYKLMDKDNNFDRKSAETQLSQLPENMQAYVVKCMDQCEHAATHLDDKCIAAWEYSKCIYFCDPEKYFLP